jgi:tol-pal system protein YbgF
MIRMPAIHAARPASRLAGSFFLLGALNGCALHADLVDLDKHVRELGKSHEQVLQRVKSIEGRVQQMEARASGPSEPLKAEGPPQRPSDELTGRIKDLEIRLAKLESHASLPAAAIPQPKVPEAGAATSEASRQSKPVELAPSSPDRGFYVPGTPDITPTSAFNLAYNDYLNGRYELAIGGFQSFLKDFPSTSLAPAAHYMIGESYYNSKNYAKATQAYERVVSEFAQSEKVPPALYKLGLAAAETGDSAKARDYLKRVVEKFPTSEEAKLAKNKLAVLR